MNRSTKMILAFAAGAAAGLITGILLAPEKGADTRKKIVDAGKDVTNKITDLIGACTKKVARNEYVNSEES